MSLTTLYVHGVLRVEEEAVQNNGTCWTRALKIVQEHNEPHSGYIEIVLFADTKEALDGTR